ncbi:hypothetical protein MBCUT_16970 [Methanobrevibacter cuticularis]|uniref:Thymidylate synthase n=1 Tax=Methanobrevibacter cuticularis TaxID=47311 RepID=A0A166CL15_9EURY|nr:DUF166 family protein [Methanobrevibacter cuticularis]KZX15157.1 hypothetical protein MBCUT_16970 [Methanobrevibacter cuticularis]
MSIRIAIVRDEPLFGKRTYETIKKEFMTELIEIESPSGIFIDDIDLDKKLEKRLSEFDLIITYIKQVDMTLELVEKLHAKVSWIIIGIWRGKGLKNQLLKYGNVSVPDTMCELENNNNPVYNEFSSKFGKPEIKINCQGERIADIEVLRGSPCGATKFIADELIGKDVKDSPIDAGLKVQHYPCKGHKLRLFSDEESHKQVASQLHHDAVKKALKDSNKKSKH